MQVRNICFIGRYHLRLHQFWKTIVPYKMERARRGEVEGFLSQHRLQRTRRLDRADVVFARNCPEWTTDRDLTTLRRWINRVDDGSRLIVNPHHSFHQADSKDRAFHTWAQAGLACPQCWELETDPERPDACLEQVCALRESEPRILLRTNNEAASHGLYVVDRDTPTDQVREFLRDLSQRVHTLKRTRRDTRAIAVEYIDARDDEGFAVLARVFVVLGRIVGYFASVSNELQFRVATMTSQCFERWVEANRELRRIVEDPECSAEIVRAVTALGNNVGAVEFLVRDGKPVFLEVNPMWSGVPRRFSFGNEEFEQMVENTEDYWAKEVPNIAENLDVVNFYRRIYDHIADYYETHVAA